MNTIHIYNNKKALLLHIALLLGTIATGVYILYETIFFESFIPKIAFNDQSMAGLFGMLLVLLPIIPLPAYARRLFSKKPLLTINEHGIQHTSYAFLPWSEVTFTMQSKFTTSLGYTLFPMDYLYIGIKDPKHFFGTIRSFFGLRKVIIIDRATINKDADLSLFAKHYTRDQ